jgi:hypothetical protein
MVLQEPIDAGFRHKAGLGVREGQLPRRQVWLCQRSADGQGRLLDQLDDLELLGCGVPS